MPRNPTWDNKRSFKRGEVYMVVFESEDAKNLSDTSAVLQGGHRAVVLFDSTFPRKTVIVAPISSLCDGKGSRKVTISTDVEIYQRDYTTAGKLFSNTIKADSFIMTNQIHSISRTKLESFKGPILDKDMTKLDLQLINTLGLQNTINALIELEVEERVREELRNHGIIDDEAEGME